MFADTMERLGGLLQKARRDDWAEESLRDRRRPVEAIHNGPCRCATVLFSDLVDSTGLSATLTPDALREVLIAYYAQSNEIIDRHSGVFLHCAGDSVSALFTEQPSRERAAARAVRAGLALLEGMKTLDDTLGRRHGIRISARISAATGLIAGADVHIGDSTMQRIVFGEVPVLAARLNHTAQPNTMVIGRTTRALVSGLFRLEFLGQHPLKGFANPEAIWEVGNTVNGHGTQPPTVEEQMHSAA